MTADSARRLQGTSGNEELKDVITGATVLRLSSNDEKWRPRSGSEG